MAYIMRIAIVGAGAIGSLLGAFISRFCDVVLVGRKEHVEAMNAAGLQVSGITDRVFEVRAAKKIPDEKFDLIIITTKAHDTEKAVLSIPAKLRSKVLFLSIQNGLTNFDALRKHVPEKNVLLGITAHGVTFIEPGHIEHAGKGETTIGTASPAAAKEYENEIALISEMFNDAGLPCRISESITQDIWAKAVINSAINPLTAITGLRNGEILEVEKLARLSESIAKESAAVADARGIKLPESITAKVIEVIQATAANKSSMLQDIERGKRTEIDSINGEISRIGKIHDVPTPYNDAVVALVKGIERSTRGE
ncbi:MAG: 2-dehydropantoate 2-reductase [Candidatus Thermoplasmatota archaeon]|nr:2-dehydropantoate 2-reductase [Candidatus Thermoplasmatota archaeon]